MLDIRMIRENPEAVRKGLQNRGGRYLPDLEQLITKDKEWRDILIQLDELRAKRNKAADEVGKLKREKGDPSAILKEMESVKVATKEKEEAEKPLKQAVDMLLLSIPNIPDASVPVGKSADDNKVVRENGTKPQFSFKAKDHHQVG